MRLFLLLAASISLLSSPIHAALVAAVDHNAHLRYVGEWSDGESKGRMTITQDSKDPQVLRLKGSDAASKTTALCSMDKTGTAANCVGENESSQAIAIFRSQMTLDSMGRIVEVWSVERGDTKMGGKALWVPVLKDKGIRG